MAILRFAPWKCQELQRSGNPLFPVCASAKGEVGNGVVRIGFIGVRDVGALSLGGSRKTFLLGYFGMIPGTLFLASITCHHSSRSVSERRMALRSSDQTVLSMDQYVDNCGLNVAYLALGYFERPIPIDELALHLEVGGYHEKPVSMEVLHQSLTHFGLAVEGLRFEKLDNMLDLLDPEHVSITFVPAVSEGVPGHFVLLTAKNNGDILLADPPKAPEILPRRDAGSSPDLANCSGEFLLVSAVPR